MNIVEALEQQVRQLGPQEIAAFRDWFHRYEQTLDAAPRCAITNMTAEQSAELSRVVTEKLLQTNPEEHTLREA